MPDQISPNLSGENTPGWDKFLKEFAAALGVQEWPGSPGASPEQMANAEQKLKAHLPPSYREFLFASNGWRHASESIPVLLPIEKIQWFRKAHPDWVRAFADPIHGLDPRMPMEKDYFNYGHEDSVHFEVKHLTQTLCVSEVGDSAVLLLNPMVVWPDGEWETWFFANWVPGAIRYRSFGDWMRNELASLLGQKFEHSSRAGELPTVYLDSPCKLNRRIRPREKILTLADVLKKLESEKLKERVTAVQQLCQLGGNEAVAALIKALKNDPGRDVRCEAADALGRLGDLDAVEPLIEAIKDSGVNTIAIHALAGFKDERSAQCLLKILEDGGIHATSAVHPLAKRRDVRAVRHLVRCLISKKQADFHIGNIAGRLIAMFEEAGLPALDPLVGNPDFEIRHRALVGMNDLAFGARDKALQLKARAQLERCLEIEKDPRMHQWLAGNVDRFTKKFQMDKNPFAHE